MEGRQPTVNHSLAGLIEQLNQEIRRLTAEAAARKAEISGIGLGIPGLINDQTIINCPNLPILNKQKLTALLMKHNAGRKIFMDNDLNCFLGAYLEKHAELKQGSLVVIALGTGIGGSIALNGRNIIANLGVSSEIGHMVIDQKTGHDFEYYYHQILGNPAGPTFTAAQAKNPAACRKVDQFANIFGLVMANLNTLINPKTVVLTGGVARYHRIYLPLVKKIISSDSFSTNRPAWKIGYDQKAGAIGASLLAE